MRKAMEKKKLRGSPASEEFALLYIRDTTNSQATLKHIFSSPPPKKESSSRIMCHELCFYFIRSILDRIRSNTVIDVIINLINF